MKERLTGAIILVALMVLLVPELLTGPVRTKSLPAAAATAASAPGAASGGTAPAQPPLHTYTLSLQPSPRAGAAMATAAPQAQLAGSIPGGSVQALAASSVRPDPGSAPQAPTAAAPQTQEVAKASVDGQERSHGPQGAAPSAPGALRSQPPPRPSTRARPGLQVAHAPAHTPGRGARSSASSRGWVVQLGSFADHQNALRLTRSLEAKGFRMSLSRARAGSRVLWRVRTGPVHDRAGAQHLAGRLRALGHRGEVLPVR